MAGSGSDAEQVIVRVLREDGTRCERCVAHRAEMRISEIAPILEVLRARREIAVRHGRCPECQSLTQTFSVSAVDTQRVGIGSSAWWSDPLWPVSGPAERRVFVLTKLRMLDEKKFREVMWAMFRRGIEPADINRDQWLDILLDMGAMPTEVRDVMSKLGFAPFRIGD